MKDDSNKRITYRVGWRTGTISLTGSDGDPAPGAKNGREVRMPRLLKLAWRPIALPRLIPYAEGWLLLVLLSGLLCTMLVFVLLR